MYFTNKATSRLINDTTKLKEFFDKYKSLFDQSIELNIDDNQYCLLNYINERFEKEPDDFINKRAVRTFLAEIS